MHDRQFYDAAILSMEAEISKLKEELRNCQYIIGVIILSQQGGTIRVPDKYFADLNKDAILTRRRDDTNCCEIFGVKNEY